jgi:hypothetical protein
VIIILQVNIYVGIPEYMIIIHFLLAKSVYHSMFNFSTLGLEFVGPMTIIGSVVLQEIKLWNILGRWNTDNGHKNSCLLS